MTFSFELLHRDGPARVGRMATPHGVVETPVFMPVGTQATVKGLTPDMVRDAGAQIILGNTYHLALRPGGDLVAELGGLHKFMKWDGPILTDSGGFQVFSLASQAKITDAGAKFRSHVDGSLLELTPEKAVEIQQQLGSDIAMVLDECPPGDAPPEVVRRAVTRSIRWAERCKAHHTRKDQVQFAIVQGGTNLDLRAECAKELVAMDFPGYALGGFSVGESPAAMHAALPTCAACLPEEKPRYLMGVGRPEDLLAGVASGIDMFDCVMPTRNGRNATAFTYAGIVKLRNSRHQRDPAPLEADCPCYCCRTFSRAYLHHLFRVDEMLGPILLSLHNIAFYLRLMRDSRRAIVEGRFADFHAECLAGWKRPAPAA
ncbi:tRNA guanosine(34) transglycosylase Tgt [Limnoglobus roseus]|uniref:Queuine tRNA-ribosyltransferase n=1 Tax=Limnoglobus roseus TaxID=2598579 RepID=A0A5C1A9W4_9BACT|nr:tRNA guanosine(34) transglycosylase Tgt [Limnoglobus roseus]QEL13828.1 tRNA guanosine(34) transglycosylase Tgt [Limnoglobus roseus]